MMTPRSQIRVFRAEAGVTDETTDGRLRQRNSVDWGGGEGEEKERKMVRDGIQRWYTSSVARFTFNLWKCMKPMKYNCEMDFGH